MLSSLTLLVFYTEFLLSCQQGKITLLLSFYKDLVYRLTDRDYLYLIYFLGNLCVAYLLFFNKYCSVQLQSSLEIAIQFENLI